MTTLDYAGTAAAGCIVAGTHHEGSAAELAKQLYDEGWREAEIRDGGRLVGAVTRDMNGARTWWGDKAGIEPKPKPAPRRRARLKPSARAG